MENTGITKMKYVNKIATVLIIFVMMLALAACGSKTNDVFVTEEKEDTKVTTEEELVVPEEEGLDQLDAMGDVEVEKGLFNVVITAPADLIGDETTQEEFDQKSKEKGYKSIILNEDGSATYTMTKAQHNEMIDEVKAPLDTSLQEMVSSEEYPNITSIVANDNYTEFTIVTISEELDMSESLSVLAFYMYGGIYNIFNGTEVDNINVKFINEASGEIITESNSRDMNE